MASIWNPGGGFLADAESTSISQVFTSTAGQTVFILSTFSYVPGTGSLQVFRNGQKLTLGKDYTETDSTRFTLLITALAAGETVEAVAVIGSTGANVTLAQQAASQAEQSKLDAQAAAVGIGVPVGYKITLTDAAGKAGSVLAAGTTAERNPTPVYGEERANSTLNQKEWWNGTAWVPMGGGATGAPGNTIFFENDITVTGSYTITAGKNAMSAGPITIADGVSVTVPNGSSWSIV